MAFKIVIKNNIKSYQVLSGLLRSYSLHPSPFNKIEHVGQPAFDLGPAINSSIESPIS